MIGMKGRVQREGDVIHIICDRIVDHTPLLRRIGDWRSPTRPGEAMGRSMAAPRMRAIRS